MTTSELKKRVIGDIEKTKDEALLGEIYRILRAEEEESNIFKFTDKQKSQIEISLKQITSGETISEEDADKEINEWL